MDSTLNAAAFYELRIANRALSLKVSDERKVFGWFRSQVAFAPKSVQPKELFRELLRSYRNFYAAVHCMTVHGIKCSFKKFRDVFMYAIDQGWAAENPFYMPGFEEVEGRTELSAADRTRLEANLLGLVASRHPSVNKFALFKSHVDVWTPFRRYVALLREEDLPHFQASLVPPLTELIQKKTAEQAEEVVQMQELGYRLTN